MKFSLYLFIGLCWLAVACNNTTAPKRPADSAKPASDTTVAAMNPPVGIPKEAAEGDFDGDGKQEYVWLVPPTLDSSGTDCVNGDCTSYLKFSNPAIPPIAVEQCIGGQPTNHGNLDDDRGDEIGLLPQWFTSCWSGYHVYTLKNRAWTPAVPDFSTYCNQWEQGVIPIEKGSSQPSHVIIRYSELDDATADIVVKEKSVAIK